MYTKDLDGSTYLADGILMNFDDNYSAEMDNDDVRKISNLGDNFAIKNDANLLIVERRPFPTVADTIKFNLSNTRVNPYRFEIDPSALQNINLKPYFKDKFLCTDTPISLSGVTNYNFNITADVASRGADRFMIVFKQVPPVRFTKINAVRNADNTAAVNWYTDNENNINTYSVQHSKDGINFTDIGSQTPTANNNGNPYYSFTHTTPVDGNNWYRIKANLINAPTQYSDIAKIWVKEIDLPTSISIYPNPVMEGKVNIGFVNEPTGKYQLVITNIAGQTIYTELLQIKAKNLQKTINLGGTAAGNYQLIVKDETGNSKKISFLIK